MASRKSVERVQIVEIFLFLVTAVLASGNILATDKIPIGPELAPREIGILLKAYPITIQQNPLAVGGVGVYLWGCDYNVGRAMITITIATKPGDRMPCKRRVTFDETPSKAYSKP